MIKRLALLLSLLLPTAAHADPVTAAVAAFAAFATTTIGMVVIGTVVLSVGTAIYGSAQARRAARDARDAQNAAMKDRMATRIAAESPHRYVYGRARVGSDIVAMFTSGDKDQYKHIVCVLAAHECDAVEEIYVNNIAVGLLNSSGDAIAGRYAVLPGAEAQDEKHFGPTFNLNRFPVAGTVQVFSGQGADMVEINATVTGRAVAVDSSDFVTVSYQYRPLRRFDDEVYQADPPTTIPFVRAQIHLGGANDAADEYLMSIVPGKWQSTAVLRGLCYLVISLDLNNPEFQNGQVPIQALVRGRKLFDPRTGTTAWSANPALAIRDYLTSPLCGVPSSDLSDAQFIAAANVCDDSSIVPGGRYTINGTVTSDQGQASVLEAMAQCMAGGIVSTSWDIYAGKYIAPVLALDQSDIVGGISITPGASDAAIYNGVKGQYLSAENGYVLTDFKPYQNDTYRADDGRDLYTNIDFPFTNTLQRVTNIARIFTEDMRNGFTMKAEFSLKAWPLKVGQRITFTSAFFGQVSKVYRVTDKSFSPNSAVELTLKEDAASIWDFADTVLLDDTPNSNLPDPWEIAPLASLACTSGLSTLLRQPDGTIIPRILVSWPVVSTQAVFTNGEVEIEWRAIGTDTWQKTKVSGSDTEAYLSPITPGWYYVVRGRTVNPYLNTKSDWTTTTYQVAVVSATATVYKWSATIPSAPSGAASYNWVTGTFGAAPFGWSLTEPAAPGGNSTRWAATVSISDISDTVPTAFEWSTASVASVGFTSPASATLYTWVKYGTSSSGAGLTDSPDGMSYIGFAYNKVSAIESTIPSDYSWSLIRGTDGTPIKGDPGVDGVTLYTWVKYSDLADGTGLYDTPTISTLYLGLAVNKTTPTKSAIKTDYVWSKFKGDQGVPGTNGTNGSNGSNGTNGARGAGTYYATGSTWSAATADTATPGANVVDDLVTISDGSTYTLTRRWNGSAWVDIGTVLDGNLLVTGSVSATKVDTRGLTVRDLAGNVLLGVGVPLDSSLAAAGTKNSEIIIGGCNLAIDSKFERGLRPWTQKSAAANSSIIEGATGSKNLFLDGMGDVYVDGLGPAIPVVAGNQYTISFEYATSTVGTITGSSSFFYRNDGGLISVALTPLNTGQARVRNTFQWLCPIGVTSISPRFGFNSTAYSWMRIYYFKVEDGNKNTTYTPAPEDVAADTAAAALTAQWTNVGGINRPADNATVGAPAGTYVGSNLAQDMETLAGATAKANAAAVNGNAALAAINDATNGLNTKLKANADNVLGGIISVNAVTAPAGFRAGTLTWNAAGDRTGGYGTAMTPKGLVGYNSGGTLTFAIDATTGNASFGGTLTAANMVGTTNLQSNATKGFDTFGVMSSYSGGAESFFNMPIVGGDLLILANVGVDGSSGSQGYNVERWNGGSWTFYASMYQTGVGTNLCLTSVPAGDYRLMGVAGYGYITNVSVFKAKK